MADNNTGFPNTDFTEVEAKPDTTALLGLLGRPSALLLRAALTWVVRTGTLEPCLPDRRVPRLGAGGPIAAIAVHDGQTVRRTAISPDLALGEAYRDGRLGVTHGDSYAFLNLCLSNIGLVDTGQPRPCGSPL